MKLIDADHLKKWILQRWEKAYPHEDLPTREVLEQIDREISYKMIDIDPQLKWIPCSESGRLPEIGDYVLCSQINGDVGEGKLLGDGSWVICYDQTCRGPYWVNAWMPLPESYKEEEDETN